MNSNCSCIAQIFQASKWTYWFTELTKKWQRITLVKPIIPMLTDYIVAVFALNLIISFPLFRKFNTPAPIGLFCLVCFYV